jgi:hypothetical protein
MIEETCPQCNRSCYLTVIDEGIGPYEFWGMPGFHHDYRVVSDCCWEPIEGYFPEDLKEDDYV